LTVVTECSTEDDAGDVLKTMDPNVGRQHQTCVFYNIGEKCQHGLQENGRKVCIEATEQTYDSCPMLRQVSVMPVLLWLARTDWSTGFKENY
jgi:hypothetical protein